MGGDFRGVIEFLLMAKRSEEAFNLAKLHGQMEMYTRVLGDEIAPEDAQNVAAHYESQHELGKAGHFYSLCGQYSKASSSSSSAARRRSIARSRSSARRATTCSPIH